MIRRWFNVSMVVLLIIMWVSLFYAVVETNVVRPERPKKCNIKGPDAAWACEGKKDIQPHPIGDPSVPDIIRPM